MKLKGEENGKKMEKIKKKGKKWEKEEGFLFLKTLKKTLKKNDMKMNTSDKGKKKREREEWRWKDEEGKKEGGKDEKRREERREGEEGDDLGLSNNLIRYLKYEDEW